MVFIVAYFPDLNHQSVRQIWNLGFLGCINKTNLTTSSYTIQCHIIALLYGQYNALYSGVNRIEWIFKRPQLNNFLFKYQTFKYTGLAVDMLWWNLKKSLLILFMIFNQCKQALGLKLSQITKSVCQIHCDDIIIILFITWTLFWNHNHNAHCCIKILALK